VGDRGGGAGGAVRDLGHLLQHLEPGVDGAAGAAGLLDRHVAEVAVRAHPARADQVGDLHDLAAEAHEEDAAEVRVARIARERAEERVVALVRPRHAAAGAVDDGHDAVDVGVVASHGAFSAASAMKRATEPEQFTEVRMPR
jgi:hypothetical protein